MPPWHRPQSLTCAARGKEKARRSFWARGIRIIHRDPQLNSVPFTLTIEKQDGRRFSGTFSSPRRSEAVIAVISLSGAIYMVDDDGYIVATMLAPNRLEMCYLSQSPTSRIASCTELTKQP